jgi:hypothetical protein
MTPLYKFSIIYFPAFSVNFEPQKFIDWSTAVQPKRSSRKTLDRKRSRVLDDGKRFFHLRQGYRFRGNNRQTWEKQRAEIRDQRMKDLRATGGFIFGRGA